MRSDLFTEAQNRKAARSRSRPALLVVRIRVDVLHDLAAAPLPVGLDEDLVRARGRHRGPGLAEQLIELLEGAAAGLDGEEEPEGGGADVPDDEDEVVLVAPALEADRVREGVDEPRAVRDQDVDCRVKMSVLVREM